ncbi:BREX-1 system phosphatase PglZ type A [Aeromonas hydrophila]|nr:BREX-1 system phosphatase PglZ type A [Aeromonas hydrophila]HAT1511220.1 BREX-1 system phosphatase PglZ type A [Aeromonas hydrophila]HAT1519993.1 BREX-1 system phosphatase PglZ type A [Aeromonas hydrophila]HAT1523622.1 BREX-1 system phosphatase PglZ type A [Aeromonas hydrophila]
MDISQLQNGLNKKFQQSRIVFWHDPEQSFTAQLVELADPQAGLSREGRPVVVLNMAQHSQLQVRRRVELEEPECPFLLYWPTQEPVPTKDWLLDMRCYSVTFYADAASILLNELGLANMALRDYIASRSSFFASKERTVALKRRLDSRSGIEDPLSLDLKMISVLLGCHAQLADVVKELAACLLDAHDEPDNALAPLDQHGLQPSLWQLLDREYGYQVAEDTKPSLREFIRKLFASDAYESLIVAKQDQRPTWLKSQLLVTPTGRANAMALLAGWRDSLQHRASFAQLSQEVARQLDLQSRLKSLPAQELLGWAEVTGFEAVEQALIRELVAGLMGSDISLSRSEFSQLVSRRRQGFWPVFEAKYASLYQALLHAENLLELRRKYPDGFHYLSAQAMYQAYETELFQFDAAYRLFNEALLHLQGQAVDVLATLSDKIEDLYVNWYLYQLGLAWDGLLAKEQQLARWDLGVPPQARFYDTVVKQRFAQTGVKRQFVIISDALRYEVAHELQGQINEAKRFAAKLGSQLGVLPSYTQLGMAALLPHQQIDYAQGSATVLVDGQSSAGLDNRSAILAKVGGIAVSAKSLQGWTRTQANDAIGDARVIYVYHDVIDAIGDKQATELETFSAVRQAIDELNNLVIKIINGFGVTRVMITADHGFLFQRIAPEDGVKAQLQVEPSGTIEAKKRYLIGRKLPANEDVWQGLISDTVGGTSDVGFWLPKGVSRFHFVGGARFVHGGAMLQEICVPVLEVQELRGKKQALHEKSKVNIVPVYQPIKLVNAIDKIRFLQTDAVGERHKPRTVRFVVIDANGQQVSAIEKLSFETTSEALEQRQQDVRLKLTGTDFDRKAQYQLLLEDDEDGIELTRYPVTIDLAFQNDFGF